MGVLQGKGDFLIIDDPWTGPWNPGNPLRKDHPGYALASSLFHNPWDDLDFHGSMIINVDPRTSMSMFPPEMKRIWDWMSKRLDGKKPKE